MNTSNKPVVIGIVDKQPGALKFAMEQARSAGSPLRVVHSAGFPPQLSEFYASADVMDDLLAAGQEVLDDAKRFVDEHAPTVKAQYILTTVPAIAALKEATVDARELILGTDDVPWYDRLLRAKVSGYLARHVDCPVIIAPELVYPDALDGDIVVALDGDTSADGPIRFAFEEAETRRSALHVLHAIPPGTLAADGEVIRANIGEVLAGWRELYPDVDVVPAFIVGDAREAIDRATRSAGLLVVGRPHGHAAAFAVSRPLATNVLRRTHCPVAVVPATYSGA